MNFFLILAFSFLISCSSNLSNTTKYKEADQKRIQSQDINPKKEFKTQHFSFQNFFQDTPFCNKINYTDAEFTKSISEFPTCLDPKNYQPYNGYVKLIHRAAESRTEYFHYKGKRFDYLIKVGTSWGPTANQDSINIMKYKNYKKDADVSLDNLVTAIPENPECKKRATECYIFRFPIKGTDLILYPAHYEKKKDNKKLKLIWNKSKMTYSKAKSTSISKKDLIWLVDNSYLFENQI